MQQKKKTIYILMPIVILVWGFVFYQLYGYFFSTPSYANTEEKTIINIDEIKKDTFSIVANYRDPFLSQKRVQTVNYQVATKTNGTSKTKKHTPPTVLKWPSIQYKGMIKNNNSERRVAIVNIDGKERIVKEGTTLNELKVVKIEKETITVSFQDEQKTINK
ncbi:MAG: hypothetical protein P1U44_12585 [Vicingaceae bacterium]|jgi:Tfp pilus assembly protein PilP|nr:hypothetical protein [Vicingaceae bacterium]